MPQCTSDRKKTAEKPVLFHVFPKEELLRKRWIHAIRRDTGKLFSISRDTCVCSNHFLDEDYCGKEKKKGARLRTGSVSSVFAWNREREVHHSAGTSRADRQRCDQSKPVFYAPPTHLEWLKKETAEAEAALEAH